MSSEIDPHTYNHIIYNKVTTGEQRKEDAVRQLHVLMEKLTLTPTLHHTQKSILYGLCITIKYETLQLLKEFIGKYHHGLEQVKFLMKHTK